PAYRDFLRARGVDAGAVATVDDFRALPLLTKEDYVRPFPLAARCRGGRLDGCEALAVSSGSTGEPTVWPRAAADELAVTARFEQVFRAFGADRRRTLAVVAFPLGTWVGGIYTTACCRWLAAKGYPVTVVSPGNVPAEVLRVVSTLGPLFEQVVLLGYPPFIKGLVDEGTARGVRWADHRIKLVLAGEVFTEEWRTLVSQRASIARPTHDVASLYGTADAGVLGNETPLSVAIRRLAAARSELARDLFGEARLPTLVQYDPHVRFLEATPEGTLLFTCDGPAPLVRYHISDRGGLVPYDRMMDRLARSGADPFAEIDRADASLLELPFAYVFGRSHSAVSYYGANVFPEMVSVAVEQPDLAAHVTGKFVMSVREDADHDTHFHVVVELAAGATASTELAATLAEAIGLHVARLSSEYGAYVPRERRAPRVELRPAGDSEYFPVGVKHRWTRRA
ncbi:MAG: phenylacetate--CoA ligase family protein, partial [Polyangiaceae bacterium]